MCLSIITTTARRRVATANKFVPRGNPAGGPTPARRTVASAPSRPRPLKGDGDSDGLNKLLKKWWSAHGDVVLHAIRGGAYAERGNGMSEREEGGVLPLHSFEAAYAPDAEYRDLFIVARGRHAVRRSFELIGGSWNMEVEAGEIALDPPTRGMRNVPEAVAGGGVVRVPFVVVQSPKLLPFIRHRYAGWVDLHLRRGSGKNMADMDLVVSVHDDRMKSTGTEYEGDVLTRVLSIPAVGSIFSFLRRVHGNVVQHHAEYRFPCTNKNRL